MKRTASDAFGEACGGSVAQAFRFEPVGEALVDPKAYFAQWQQASMAFPMVASTASSAASSCGETEVLGQVAGMSAVRCASFVKDKGHNFSTAVAVEALCVMATKSSFKLREELLRQTHVRKLCDRVRGTLCRPPAGIALDLLARSCKALIRFPTEVLGQAQATLGPTAAALAQAHTWSCETAATVLWCLAKADVVMQHKQLVSMVVKELVSDLGRRVAELSHENLVNLLWAVARSRRHIRQGDHTMIRTETNDETLFKIAAKRVCDELSGFDVRLLAELAHTHAEIGIKNEGLFKTISVKILAKQKDLKEDVMGRAIKAYARFMIPLTEEKQGFRTMAVVQKGDFIRPSDKPKKRGNHYDKPQALFDKTPVHSM